MVSGNTVRQTGAKLKAWALMPKFVRSILMPDASTPSLATARGLADKQILTICDLAILHGLSRRTVARLYENEPGVQVLQASRAHQQRIGRRYRTIRVPRHVYLRVKQPHGGRMTDNRLFVMIRDDRPAAMDVGQIQSMGKLSLSRVSTMRHQVDLAEPRRSYVPTVGLHRDVMLQQRARLGASVDTPFPLALLGPQARSICRALMPRSCFSIAGVIR